MNATTSDRLAISSTQALRDRARQSLQRCGATVQADGDAPGMARTPITGEHLFEVPQAGPADVDAAIAQAGAAFAEWRNIPAPVRGSVVKRFGALLTDPQR